MVKSLRNKIATLTAGLALVLAGGLAPVAVYAAPASNGSGTSPSITDNLACGTTLSVNTNGCTGALSTGTEQIQSIVTKTINIFSVIVGIVAVIMIIVGGFKYITSGGDSGKISGAKNTIIYAIIGLIIVALAQFLVQYVLDKVIS